MNTHSFTEAQAKHANEVVLKLIRKRRFFLREDNKYRNYDIDCNLNPDVFGYAMELDRKICASYVKARSSATKIISDAEKKLGVVKPDISGNKQSVICSRYTGGLDICQVYPITAFTRYAPDNIELLFKQCFHQLMDGKNEDDIPPKTVREYKNQATKLAEIIWKQLEEMGAHSTKNERCAVIMKTRFSCESSDDNNDFMHGKVWDMQDFPYAMGYLFHFYSMHERIVRHGHVVFSTSRISHVNIQHRTDEKPTISYNKKHGYTFSVIFVTVL